MTDKMRSCVKGLILGLFGSPLPAAKREPVAYLYNGVRAPKLPESELPYAVIALSPEHNPTYLYFSSEPLAYSNNTALDFLKADILKTTKSCAVIGPYDYEPDADQWVYRGNDEGEYEAGKQVMYLTNSGRSFWANYALYDYDDGTLFQAASDPVPVYE